MEKDDKSVKKNRKDNIAKKPAGKKRIKTAFKFDRKKAPLLIAAAALLLLVAVFCMWFFSSPKEAEPQDVFTSFIETVKTENINAAAEKHCVSSEALNIAQSSFAYRLIEAVKINYSYSFVTQTYTNDGESAVISVNLTAVDLSALSMAVDNSISELPEYLAAKTDEERSNIRMNEILALAQQSGNEHLIINTVEVGFSKADGSWKIIVDEQLIKTLAGYSQIE